MVQAAELKSQSAVTIDIRDRFAALQVLAALICGADVRRNKQLLATVASIELGAVKTLREQPFRVGDLETICRLCGLPGNQIARMPGTRAVFESYFRDPEHSEEVLRREVFDPAGHYLAVADAPGVDTQLKDAECAERGRYFAGSLLLMIGRMHYRHRELDASLKRALTVLIKSASGIEDPPSDRTLLEAWTEWRHLAPLWAAYTLELRRTQRAGLSVAAGLEAVFGPGAIKRILSHAKWFTDFAVTFIPIRAQGPLISRGQALRINADVEAVKPDFEPLTPQEIAAAKGHRAPTQKFW